MLENLFNHFALMPLDKADDLHFPAALGAEQRIGLIHLLDQRRPALARGLAIGAENRFSIAFG